MTYTPPKATERDDTEYGVNYYTESQLRDEVAKARREAIEECAKCSEDTVTTLAIIKGMRQFDVKREIDMVRESATMRVAMREIMEASNWAYGVVADKLGGV